MIKVFKKKEPEVMPEVIPTETKEEPKITQKYSLGKVATQTGLAPIDNETGEAITELELLIQIANEVSDIKRNVVG